MEEQNDKQRLLTLMDNGYGEFSALIAPLNATQLTAPGVDHDWSIKDFLVHLAFWHHLLLTYLQAALQDVKPERMSREKVDSMRRQFPGADEALAGDVQQPAPIDDFSDLNDYIYLRNKNRSLHDVQSDFHDSYAEIVATVRSMDEALLFEPGRLSWADGNALYIWVAGNTYGHYEEHIKAIKNWLSANPAPNL